MRLSRFAFLWACLVVVGALLAQRYAAQQAARIFGNATYVMWDGYTAQAATLVDGIHDEPYLDVRYDEQYVYGDFNGDKVKDAAVIIIENNGGTATWHTLAFLINESGKWVHKASRVLDDRAIINAMWEKGGAVAIDMFVHQEGDCRAGPTKRVQNVYRYEEPDGWGEILVSPYQRIYAEGVRAFEAIYATPAPAQIRQTFNRTIHAHEDCMAAHCAFANLFARKFIVVDVTPDDSSGLAATLIFENSPHPYLLQMHEAGDGRYVLREMTKLRGLLGDGFVQRLQNPAYQPYWL